MVKAKKRKNNKKSTLRKRARNALGHYLADDPGTPDVNEAYVQEKEPFSIKWLIPVLVLSVIVVIFVLIE